MKNKIQPAQYDPYTLISSSGNILVNSGVDFFNLDVSRSLQGDFNFIDSIKIDGMNCISPDSTNSVLEFSNGNRVLAGSYNSVSGSNSFIYGGFNSLSRGTNNVIVYGNNSNITGPNNSIALGNSITITHNNATVFGDTSSNSKGSNGINTLTLNYVSGTFIEHNCFIKKGLNIQNNLLVTGNITGANIISNNNISALNNLNIRFNGFIGNDLTVTGDISTIGDLSIIGNTVLNHATITGSRIQTQNDINNYSGYVDSLLAQKLAISALPSQSVVLTGNQDVYGRKSFRNISEFYSGLKFTTTDTSRYVPKSGTASGEIGHMVYSGNFLYVATGTNQWGRVQISAWA
jgi:predicted acyltransferase (DUF342 family)